MEGIRDLLDTSKTNLQLHEDFASGRGVYVADATEAYVSDAEELFHLMQTGAANRMVASTRMNSESSRSHSIFTIAVTQKHNGRGEQKSGKLCLVDLAGSESAHKSKAEGQQLEEAKQINKSLTTLGMVINALTDKKATHVPYRDSKLTRLLQVNPTQPPPTVANPPRLSPWLIQSGTKAMCSRGEVMCHAVIQPSTDLCPQPAASSAVPSTPLSDPQRTIKPPNPLFRIPSGAIAAQLSSCAVRPALPTRVRRCRPSDSENGRRTSRTTPRSIGIGRWPN